MAGNVTSATAVEFLADCGADIIKVGQDPARFARHALSPVSVFLN